MYGIYHMKRFIYLCIYVSGFICFDLGRISMRRATWKSWGHCHCHQTRRATLRRDTVLQSMYIYIYTSGIPCVSVPIYQCFSTQHIPLKLMVYIESIYAQSDGILRITKHCLSSVRCLPWCTNFAKVDPESWHDVGISLQRKPWNFVIWGSASQLHVNNINALFSSKAPKRAVASVLPNCTVHHLSCYPLAN